MDIDPEEKQGHQKDKVEKARRGFLKKAVYVTPTIIVLNGLIKPTSTNAGFSGTPYDP